MGAGFSGAWCWVRVLGAGAWCACLVLCAPRPAAAYSVLTHLANVDAAWEEGIRPVLLRRFPGTGDERLVRARAHAYGGSIIQDLGYYPFGSHFFSNLVHYARTGDFVEALIREAQDVDEYAFALGALAHYAADNAGHPIAVNRSVALIYPKLRAKFGDEVTYAESPKGHILTEFAFDVVQVAAGVYLPEAYHRFVGFEVSKPVLARAFHATYGIALKDVFLDEDLTIATYRFAVGKLIPDVTKVAWQQKRKEIEKLIPGVQRSQFVFDLPRRKYEEEFGSRYRKPGGMARFLGFLYKLLPKIGPLRVLSFEPPTPEAEALFLESFKRTREQYVAALETLHRAPLNLPNRDFDTGRPTAQGEYPLADETYAEWLDELADDQFAGLTPAARQDILAFYAAAPPAPPRDKKGRERLAKVRVRLAALRATPQR